MFERFTDRARRVVVLAQEEARLLNHNYIGTEHILLGLIHEGGGVAARGLQGFGIRLDSVRSQVVETIGQGHQSPSGHIPFTPRAKKVLELSLREALQLGHNYIGTEHILLGLIREGDGVVAQVLEKLGADLPKVRHTVIRLLSEGLGDESATAAMASSRAEEPYPEGRRVSGSRSGRGSPVEFSGVDDSITLQGLRIPAHHGVTDRERAAGQTFVVDVNAYLDVSAAGRSDELSSTVDYATLAEAIHRRVSGERWNLIERVAERVADLVLEDRRVSRVDVTVHKPEAPITVEFEDVAVTVVRHSPHT